MTGRRESNGRHGWQCLGPDAELREPGDFFLARLLGEDVIVVLDEVLGVRAFRNACRHWGARVCTVTRGSTTEFVCPFHGWAYDSAGRLLGPDGPLANPKFGLDAVGQLVNLHGMLWANWDPLAPPLPAIAVSHRRPPGSRPGGGSCRFVDRRIDVDHPLRRPYRSRGTTLARAGLC